VTSCVLQNALFYVSVSVLYLIGSSLVIHLIHMYHESYSWVPKWTRDQLLVTGVSSDHLFYLLCSLTDGKVVILTCVTVLVSSSYISGNCYWLILISYLCFLLWHMSGTGCPGGNVPDFGRMFLQLKYTDITKNTYIRSWTFTEIKAREKCGLLAVPRTVPGSRDVVPIHCPCPSLSTAGSSAFTLWLHM